MKQSLLLTNAKVVLPDRVVSRVDVLLDDGLIAALDPDSSGCARRVDLDGRLLMPGMIDLHCDALEKEVEPRPDVHFPLNFACAQADKRNAAAGITTVYHAIAFAHQELGVRNIAFAADLARAVHAWQVHALVENRVHARYEVTDPEGPEVIQGLVQEGILHLLSFMDHTPGQGQYKDAASYRQFLARTYKRTEQELDEILARKTADVAAIAGRVGKLAALAKAKGIPLASHDDDSPERMAALAGLGVSISEFPIDLATAKAARSLGIATLVGAPNLLRGASMSGALLALDAVREGVADCLCGDYSPAALLPSVLKLAELGECGLADAVALVTRNPARAVGLSDRGEIRVGRRADLIAVRQFGDLPQVERVWVGGKATYRAHFDKV
jgi:alpha-D-ribose 1-methylphosphonate 5-triphosphate diphosphatase